ncbi:hypothetical protein [Allochromatium tepidum]|uniref:Uncharacterized protein n=1 Tax=Allochromatium tepidum TaxID=553982 RepID=A0ABM7QR13_9GAMM|nr:hypothetical protein [Allochromatium tepidum]BCU08477.1 hypothetical protein Atep_31540 [Allochromatium tepidum]
MNKHEIAPIPGAEYRVNGETLVVRAVNDYHYFREDVPNSVWGRYVYLSKKFKTGRISKSTVRFRNDLNDPSWYEQSVEKIHA